MAYKCNAQFSSVNRLMNFTRLIFKIPCDCINFPIKSYVGSVTSILCHYCAKYSYIRLTLYQFYHCILLLLLLLFCLYRK